MKRRPSLGFVLAASHVDVHLAKLWLRWATFLSRQPAGDVSRHFLVVTLTRRISAGDQSEIEAIVAEGGSNFFQTTISRLDDECEIGYPGSSSHLFCRSFQCFDALHPGMAMMFCEADSVPMHPRWAADLAEDYARRTQPFVGLHIRSTEAAIDQFGMPPFHLTGNAMYPPNTLKLAPGILQCLDARRDNGPWKEKGWAWDLFCAHEIMPLSEQTNRIQQLWRPDPWNEHNLERISKETALFHQCKDGTLIITLAAKHYPTFFKCLPVADAFYMLETGLRSVTLGGFEIAFTPAAIGPGGRILAIHHPEDPMQAALLRSAAGRKGLVAISRADYESLLAQAKRNRLD